METEGQEEGREGNSLGLIKEVTKVNQPPPAAGKRRSINTAWFATLLDNQEPLLQ